MGSRTLRDSDWFEPKRESNNTKRKLCPLRKSVVKDLLNASREEFLPCDEGECAWFDPASRSCAILLIAGVLRFKVEVENA
jgi:hypothetical protein